MRRHHDMGGNAAGPIELDQAPTEPWAKTLTAVFGAVREKGLGTVDELRRHLEDLPPEVYDRGYFQRWAEAACDHLEEKGVLTRAEVEARMEAIKAELEAKK